MEIKNELLEIAYRIALQAHQGQTDKGGVPYIEHPLCVAKGVDTLELKVIAMLHDVIEDGAWTREDLVREGIPEYLVEVVCLLTHDKEAIPDYMEYIEMISKNAMARKVKMSDLRHNMDITRIPNPGKSDYDRVKKYQKAYAFLQKIDQTEQ